MARKAGFNKETFKKAVKDNVKTLFRKTIAEAGTALLQHCCFDIVFGFFTAANLFNASDTVAIIQEIRKKPAEYEEDRSQNFCDAQAGFKNTAFCVQPRKMDGVFSCCKVLQRRRNSQYDFQKHGKQGVQPHFAVCKVELREQQS